MFTGVLDTPLIQNVCRYFYFISQQGSYIRFPTGQYQYNQTETFHTFVKHLFTLNFGKAGTAFYLHFQTKITFHVNYFNYKNNKQLPENISASCVSFFVIVHDRNTSIKLTIKMKRRPLRRIPTSLILIARSI